MESNQTAEAEEIDAKYKEIEAKFNPIMQRVYQATGGQPGAEGMNGMNFGGQQQQPGPEAHADDLD